jgi:putative acetyltransferase
MSTFSIRNETPQDHEDVRQIHNLAFGGPAPGKLADDLRKGGEAVISLVAHSDGKLRGHIMLSRLKGPMKALMLAPFAVHPDFQTRGIGIGLLHKALEQAKKGGWAAVFVLGDKGYYEHAGYTVKKGNSSPQGGEYYVVLSTDAGNASMAGQVVVPPSFRALK